MWINVYMFYQLILKLKLHGQCGKGPFIFNIANDLNNG
jgi:hypothetical protein